MCKNINYQELAKKMYDLYIVKDYPFIKKDSDGKYSWVYNLGKLSDNNYEVLIRHLQRKQTIGIFCHTHTKMICFDVDMKKEKQLCKWYSLKVINCLEQFGISRDYIYVNYSGSKGYHIEVFFDDVVSLKQIECLYDLVIEEIYYETDYDNLEVMSNLQLTLEQLKSKIELRPLKKIGVKMPLSIHQKTKDVCYFCDNFSFEPIKSIEYLYQIKQLPRELVADVIRNGLDCRNDRNKINYFNNEIKPYVKPVRSQQLFTDENYTMEYVINLINNGLQIQGSRHNSLMKIARYYYHFRLEKAECEELMVDWMLRQDKKYYNSDEIEWRNDIKSIIKYVYDNNKGLVGVVRDISINKEEMLEILKFKERKKKLLFYALIIHAKRYSLTNRSFYMTYAQIEESCGVTRPTATKYIKQLNEENEINILRQNEFRNNSCIKLPNTYQMINEKIKLNSNDGYLVKKEIKDLENEFNKTIIQLFSKKEIKKLIPDTQYREIRLLYAI